jgi:hypothetical protein
VPCACATCKHSGKARDAGRRWFKQARQRQDERAMQSCYIRHAAGEYSRLLLAPSQLLALLAYAFACTELWCHGDKPGPASTYNS